MPLRIELAPNERVIIGDTSIRNGSRRSEFIVETQTRVLRERDIITEREADTPCKRLYLVLEAAYLSQDRTAGEARFMTLASEVMKAAPSTAPVIADVFDSILQDNYYRALKRAKQLIAIEAGLLRRADALSAQARATTDAAA